MVSGLLLQVLPGRFYLYAARRSSGDQRQPFTESIIIYLGETWIFTSAVLSFHLFKSPKDSRGWSHSPQQFSLL